MSFFNRPTSVSSYDVTVLKTNEPDHIVDYRYKSSAQTFDWFSTNPIAKDNYSLVAVVNGGAFKALTGKPISTCVINGVEYAEDKYHGDNTPDMFLKNDHLRWHWEFYDSDLVESGIDVQRGSYGFSFHRGDNGVLNTYISSHYNSNNELVENQIGTDLYIDSAKRVGVGFVENSSVADIIIINEEVTGEQYKSICDTLGYDVVVNLDGGKSTALWHNGYKVIEPERNLHEVIYIYKRTGNTTVATNLSVMPVNEPVRILDYPVDGSTRAIVNSGTNVKIVYFLTGFRTDGYQWAKVIYNGIEGYCKLNTFQACRIYGSLTSQNVYICTTYHAAYIRSKAISGNVLVTVPKGTRFKILNFLGTMSDGYQWAETEYNGIKGFTQIDLYNWHYLTL